MQELWLDKGLVSEEKWSKLISGLQSDTLVISKPEAIRQLKELLIQAVHRRITDKFGIFFSGGVDSSLLASIAKHLKQDFICYAVGFQYGTKEPEDVIEAKKVAAKLGFKLKAKIFNLEEAEQIINKTVQILKSVNKIDVVTIGVGAVVLAASELAERDHVDYFLGGLGSEEIFAGYERHKVEDINQECWRGLKAMWSRDFVRDYTLANKLDITVRTPFLDEELIKYAMQLPGEWKLNEKGNKLILREVAEEFLGEFAWRKKRAAQYGSCFDKAINKLAKQKGFKYKKDYLFSL